MKKIIFSLILVLSFTSSFSQEAEFGKISIKDLKEKKYSKNPNVNACYLVKNKKIYFEYDDTTGWTLVTQVFERIKIYNKKGYEYATKSIHLYQDKGKKEIIGSFKAFTYNIDNEKTIKQKLKYKNLFKEKKSDYVTTQKFSMPNIKEGSIIEWKYSIRSPFFTSIDKTYLQESIPIKKLQLNVKIPEYFVFKNHISRYYPFKIKEIKERRQLTIKYRQKDYAYGAKTTLYEKDIDFDEKKYSISLTNIPAISNNNDLVFINNINNYRSSITFELSHTMFPNSSPQYYTTSWKDVSKKIHQYIKFGGQLNKTGYYRKDLVKILNGTLNDYEKTTTILRHVKSKIKWNGIYGKYTHNGVKKAYNDGIGNVADINLTLTSMLREAGLDANPVLISTKSNGIPLFPTINGFNYVITIVYLENSYLLLDATEPYSIPNLLPSRALNWNGRVITKNGNSSWINLRPKYAVEQNKVSLKLEPDNKINGIMRTTYSNLNALLYRKSIDNKSNEDIKSVTENKYNIEIEDFKITNKNKIYKPITRSLKFLDENSVEEIGNKKYITPLIYLAMKKNPFKLEERKFPIDFTTPWRKEISISIMIPKSYEVSQLPESISIELPEKLGIFKYTINQKGNKINVMSALQINNTIVTPQLYQTIKEFYSNVVTKQDEKIILVKNKS